MEPTTRRVRRLQLRRLPNRQPETWQASNRSPPLRGGNVALDAGMAAIERRAPVSSAAIVVPQGIAEP